MWVRENGVVKNLPAIKEIDNLGEKVILNKDTILELSEDEMQVLINFIHLGYSVEVFKQCTK